MQAPDTQRADAAARLIERGDWEPLLGELARELAGAATSVAVLAGRDDGQLGAAGGAPPPLRTIGFDPDSDTLELAVGGGPGRRPTLRYFISSPRRIVLIEESAGRAVVIEDDAGARTLVRISRHGAGAARSAKGG